MSKIIGIDLGTTNSVVSVMEGRSVQVIKQLNGDKLLPSLVAINNSTGEIIVGANASNVAVDNDWTLIRSVKSSMGKNKIINKENGEEISIAKSNGEDYRPEEISALILRELKKAAENVIGEEVTKAIITVPAYFNDAERNATKNAGEIAGLEVERVINEPTAAAIDYGFGSEKNSNESGNMLIYDFGGGTFDVSIIEIDDDQTYQVLATGGDSHLGGDNIDKLLSELITEKFFEVNDSNDIIDLFDFDKRVYEEAINTKKYLSFQDEVNVSIPMVGMGKNGPINLSVKVDVHEFNDLIEPLIQDTIDTTNDVIRESGLSINQVDKVLLVGGSTRIPLVKRMVSEDLGMDASLNIDPDESVSRGATIQGGHLTGNLDDVLLLDVTSHDLGIITIGDNFSKLIDKNTTIPVRKKDIYTNVQDWQETILIQVVQGNHMLSASSNEKIGEFIIPIVEKRKGEAGVEVTFELDNNGILQVTAIDLDTGVMKSITITNENTMSDDEVRASKLIIGE